MCHLHSPIYIFSSTVLMCAALDASYTRTRARLQPLPRRWSALPRQSAPSPKFSHVKSSTHPLCRTRSLCLCARRPKVCYERKIRMPFIPFRLSTFYSLSSPDSSAEAVLGSTVIPVVTAVLLQHGNDAEVVEHGMRYLIALSNSGMLTAVLQVACLYQRCFPV